METEGRRFCKAVIVVVEDDAATLAAARVGLLVMEMPSLEACCEPSACASFDGLFGTGGSVNRSCSRSTLSPWVGSDEGSFKGPCDVGVEEGIWSALFESVPAWRAQFSEEKCNYCRIQPLFIKVRAAVHVELKVSRGSRMKDMIRCTVLAILTPSYSSKKGDLPDRGNEYMQKLARVKLL
jgi:hypothetical protein